MRFFFLPVMLFVMAPFFLSLSAGAQEFMGEATIEDYCTPPISFCGTGGVLPVTISPACETPTGDAILRVTDSGSTGTGSGWYNVNVEGLDLGNLFNRNPADDDFDNGDGIGDGGPECEGAVGYDAVIPLNTLMGIVADGAIVTTLTSPATNSISDCGGEGDITVSIRYPCQETPPVVRRTQTDVPTLRQWGTILLSVLLLVSGLWLLQRRKRRVP